MVVPSSTAASVGSGSAAAETTTEATTPEATTAETETTPTETGETATTDTGGDGEGADGEAVFASAGCGACHTLKEAGTSGTVGPDLEVFCDQLLSELDGRSRDDDVALLVLRRH